MSQITSRGRAPRKSWHASFAQSEMMHFLIAQATTPLRDFASALVLPDGKTVAVVPSTPADLASLPQAAFVCHQYLRLKDGDVALVNDPTSGGTSLNHLTLVMGVRFDAASDVDPDLLIAARFTTEALWGTKAHLDEEGVRIPPTPLASRGQINRELLGAIAAHPLSPARFAEKIEDAVARLDQVRKILKSFGKDPSSELKVVHFKRYLADSAEAFETVISRIPLGTAQVAMQLHPGGEMLKLRLEITEKRLHFDFAGTDASTLIHLTELATFGACVSAIMSAAQARVPLNSGVMDHFQVSTPAKTLLSTKAPEGTFRGMNSGLAAVCDLVQKGLAKLNPSFRMADAATGTGYFELAFKDGRRASGKLLPGSPASSEREGLDSFALWGATRGPAWSIEELERHAPVTVTAAGIRAGTGGKGKRRGGDGQLIAILTNEPARFSWAIGQLAHRHLGLDAGKLGIAAQFEIVRSSGETVELKGTEGTAELGTGDEIRMYASGGGGCGEPESSKGTSASSAE